jgi:hypothetical protein
MTYELTIDISDELDEGLDQVIREVEALKQYGQSSDPNKTVEVDIDELLADHQAIGIVWDIQHVQDQRPDLSDEHAWEVLQECQRCWERLNDPMLETIRQVAANLYPTGKEALRRRAHSLLNALESLPEREVDNPAAYGAVAAQLDDLEAAAKGA